MKVSRLLAYTLWVCALVVPCGAQEEKPTGGGESVVESQVTPPGPGRRVGRLVAVANRDIIFELMTLVRGLGVEAYASRELGVITLFGLEDAVTTAEDTIRRYDVSPGSRPEAGPNNADFTAYLIVARLEGESVPVPDVLESVVAQLRGVLPFKSYELAETVTVRVADTGLVEAVGILPPLSSALSGSTRYELALQNVRLPRGGPDRPPAGWVSLDPFLQLEMTRTEDGEGVSSTIKTRIEIREGQKVVVGKVAIDGAGTSLILVLAMKLDG